MKFLSSRVWDLLVPGQWRNTPTPKRKSWLYNLNEHISKQSSFLALRPNQQLLHLWAPLSIAAKGRKFKPESGRWGAQVWWEAGCSADKHLPSEAFLFLFRQSNKVQFRNVPRFLDSKAFLLGLWCKYPLWGELLGLLCATGEQRPF